MNLILFEAAEVTGTLARTDTRAKHILKVLRLGLGDSCRGGYVGGDLFHLKIIGIDKDNIYYSFSEAGASLKPYPITLVCGIPRPNSVRRILRDCSSLGVSQIIFVNTELGEKSYRDSKLLDSKNFRPYLLEGASQAYTTHIPQVEFATDFKHVLTHCQKSKDQLYYFDANPELGHVKALRSFAQKSSNMVLFIGSERGWSDNERQILAKSKIKGFHLGPRILRTDTAFLLAVAYACALYQ